MKRRHFPGTIAAPSLEWQGSGSLFEVGNDVIVMDHGPGAHHGSARCGAA